MQRSVEELKEAMQLRALKVAFAGGFGSGVVLGVIVGMLIILLIA